MLELVVDKEILGDAINIADKVYAPLNGFLGQEDLRSVLSEMRLKSGELWSIPIVFDLSEEEADKVRFSSQLRIRDWNDTGEAILGDLEVYEYDKELFKKQVFGTTDVNHPGVAGVETMKPLLLSGRVLTARRFFPLFAGFNLSPELTRRHFKKQGWRRIAAFQTRNVPHLGHEFLQKEALKRADGLMVQPVIGEKKIADFKDEYIVACYHALLKTRFPAGRTLLNILPMGMRYAGPREALHHALIRKNYGCTHFVVGRDHAGVGDYYHKMAAQEIFNDFSPAELGIEILKFGEAAFDRERQTCGFSDQIPPAARLNFSGTQLRDIIKQKKAMPGHLLRPEVHKILINSENSLIDPMYKKENMEKGFVLWFTGLSAAGKTTIADEVYRQLKEKGWKLERLDGDIVRENLAKGLGFSRQDRDENIRRIGFVAGLLARNGVGVVASFISPYRAQRQELREKIENFVEVFVDTPLAVCESRDPKGMYKKARTGEIKLFTGISDPYEAPEAPEIRLVTPDMGVEECARKVVEYLSLVYSI